MSGNNFFHPFSAVILHRYIALICLEKSKFFFGKIAGSYATDFEGVATRAERQMIRWYNLTNLLKISLFLFCSVILFLFGRNLAPLN